MLTSLLAGVVAFSAAQEDAVPEFEIVAPARGEIVRELRPVIATTPVADDQVVYIEISPEPQFANNNTMIFVGGPDEQTVSLAVGRSGWLYEDILRGMNAYERSNRYREGDWNEWRVNYNLTAVLLPPYGYRQVGCREFLRAFTDRVTEGHEDPADAIFEFVSAYVVNEGTNVAFYDAYEILSRSMGVCGHTAELMSAMSVAAGLESRILSIRGTTGHIISEVQTADGWEAFDPLYHIAFNRSADEIVEEVNSDEDALNYTIYPNAPFVYRDMFSSYLASPSLQTTIPGTVYTTDPQIIGTTFDDLAFSCSAEQLAFAEQVETTVFRNVWFVRAAVGDE
ncbi:transglutaminase-like domain-containing protein [Hyphobacterium sp.]|uniref:transglutaminase-like domain-containing protein n=1 Tax=Hyphobacterium sp. TaxID=2004662 RepID=UPI003BAA46A0